MEILIISASAIMFMLGMFTQKNLTPSQYKEKLKSVVIKSNLMDELLSVYEESQKGIL